MYSLVDGFLVINLYCVQQFFNVNKNQILGLLGLILIIILYTKRRIYD